MPIIDLEQCHFSTRSLYADYVDMERDEWSTAPPIHQSVSGVAASAEEFARRASVPLEERFYARHGNPTSARLARVIANLEGAEAGVVFASGQGTTSTTFIALLSAGDHVVAQRNHYMGTTKMLSQVLGRYGVEVTFVDQRSVEAFERALRPDTRLIVLETPVNPLMHVTDLGAVCGLARSRGILTFCDNTFATPVNQQPVELGVDLVMHSTTKYIGGHHDHLGGCVCGPAELCARIWDTSMTIGAIPAPFNSWLGLRGVRTLEVRVQRQNANALALATMLERHPAVRRVFYPGLASHPQHDLAARQMSGFGGLLTWEMEGGYAAADDFIRALSLGHNAPSLGGVQSVAIQPAVMFGGRLSPTLVEEQGILPGMVRFACGIEHTGDLLHAVQRALR